MSTGNRFVAPLFALSMLCGGAAVATPDCSVTPSLTPLQQRVTASAGDGVDALRRFVAIRQVIYRYDVRATMERGMQHHDWLTACSGKAARIDAAVPGEGRSVN